MRCYQIISKSSDTVVYEYWANAPYVWVETHYPWSDTVNYSTIEAPIQPQVAPTLDLVEGLSYSVFDFVNRFDMMEHAAIVSSVDPLVKAFHDKLTIAAAQGRRIYKDNPDTQGGLLYLASLGILTPARVAEIGG